MHAAGQGKICVDFSMQDGDPAQGEAQFGRCAQVKAVDDFQFIQIEIGLVEAVEQNQSVCTRFDNSARKIRQGM